MLLQIRTRTCSLGTTLMTYAIICIILKIRTNVAKPITGSRLWCPTVSLLLFNWYMYPGSGVVLDCIDS